MSIQNPKVLYFHMEYPPILGGGASYTKNLLKQLTQLKVEIILITNGLEDSIEKVNNHLTIKRFKIFHDMYNGRGGLLRGVDILLEEIRKESPDILHTVYIEEALIGKIANLNYGIPHIVTHTKTPMYREESIKKNSTWSLFDYVNRNTSITYITPGLAYRNSLLQSGVDNKSIKLIYPGIDQNIFKKITNTHVLNRMRKRLKINRQDSVILIPCMLRKRKGLSFVAEALSDLKIPGHDIKVIITGTAKSEEERQIYQDFKKKIGSRVEVVEHDWFSDEDMPILFNIADTMVLCSEAEGYGTVFLEAMACECPIIGSNVIGINESVTNGYNGILCKYGDRKALKKAVIKMIINKDARKKYVKNSLLVLENKYNLQKQADNHLRLYRTFSKRIQQAGCVLYRYLDNTVEVYLSKDNKLSYRIPKLNKNRSESWLQASIRSARLFSGHQVTLPNHLILDDANKNKVSYSFNIITKKKEIPLNTNNLGIWLNLDNAINLISLKTDKKVLQKLKSNLRGDKNVKEM
jgi:glycosyltransferase involved in cell wall biosynthesis